MRCPHRMRLREPDTWAAEMYGTRIQRAADGPPFLLPVRHGA